ncbi:RDD family protein [bacterium]|nr:RDD family protein [bacterium]
MNQDNSNINDDMRITMGGFWIRSLAFTTDIIIIYALQSILSLTVRLGILTGARVLDMSHSAFFDLKTSMINFIKIFVICAYFIYFHATTGQTLGKRVFRLRVVSAEGMTIGFVRSALRFIAYIISALPLCMGFILIALNHKKQGLHDFVCQTYVIKTCKSASHAYES